jgi:acyl carrier protein
MTDPMITQLNKYLAIQILKQPNTVIDGDDPLISSGLVDSFHLVDLALFIEDQFGVRIDDTELTVDTFDTLNQLAALIHSRQAG